MSSSAKAAVIVTILLASSSGLRAEPKPDYKDQDGWRMFGTALPAALDGNRHAVHDCLMASYLRASSPFLGGEDCEAIYAGLSELLFTGGDRAFSQALGVERPEVVAAVGFWIGHSAGFFRHGEIKTFSLDAYPKAKHALDAAPKVDFPLNEDSPRRPPLLKQLSVTSGWRTGSGARRP